MSAIQLRNDVSSRQFILSGDTRSRDTQTLKQVSAATAGSVTDTFTHGADQDGLTFGVKVDGGATQTVTFAVATTTAVLVASGANPQLVGASVSVVGGHAVITSDSTGVNSSIEIVAGTSALTWDTPVAGTGGEGMAFGTVVSKDPATSTWVALTNVAATDGTEHPRGIYVGEDVTSAALEAAAVTGKTIMIGGPCEVDESQIVFQGTATIDAEITNQNLTVRDALHVIGIYPMSTSYQSGIENL